MHSFLTNIYLTIQNILLWHIPGYFVRQKIYLIIIVLIIILLSVLLLKKITSRDLFLTVDKKVLVILSLFITNYLLLLILISTSKAHDDIESRLLSPIYIPIIFSLLIILKEFINRISYFRQYKLFRIAFYLFLILVMAKPLSSTIDTMNNHINRGKGYSSISWKNYDTIELLKYIQYGPIKDLAIYSNDPFAVYYFLNIPVKWSPLKTYYNSDKIFSQLSDLNGEWPTENNAYLVWFKQAEYRKFLYTPKELMSISDMNITDSNKKGTIYLVKIKIQ